MRDGGFDVWLHAMSCTTHEPPAHALSRVFGLSLASAQALLASLPCVVKHGASAELAERMVGALRAIGGHAEAVAAPPRRAATSDTLKLGTQELPILRERLRPAPPPQSLELAAAPARQAARDDLPATWLAEDPAPAGAQRADDGWRDPLALPASQAPPSRSLRSPSERARDPQRRAPPPRTGAARVEVRGVLAPVDVALEIWTNAERSSWQSALSGHPVAGFLIVLLATTSVFLLIFAVMWK